MLSRTSIEPDELALVFSLGFAPFGFIYQLRSVLEINFSNL